ncbi:MAG TPA: DUF120 domain-containing protein [archaeon]|nr:DUF120 domain-containing protein [archaeon]
MQLKGKIVSGSGVGAKIMVDYLEKFRQVFKMDVFPGTLNLQLEKEWEMPQNSGYIEGFTKPDGTKRGGVYFLRAKMKNFPVFIIRPQLTRHPKNIIELVSPINIRKQYGLKDGDFLEIHIK